MAKKRWWYVEKLVVYDRFPQVVDTFITQNPNKYPTESQPGFTPYFRITEIIAKN